MKKLLKLKRIYEDADESDGYRVLVDRLWPRGISKEKAKIDCWMKELGPPHELRTWFNHKPERFEAFVEKYKDYLIGTRDCQELIQQIIERIENEQPVTLVFASKDVSHNQAVVLREVLLNLLSCKS